jgi:hypothetical protein
MGCGAWEEYMGGGLYSAFLGQLATHDVMTDVRTDEIMGYRSGPEWTSTFAGLKNWSFIMVDQPSSLTCISARDGRIASDF